MSVDITLLYAVVVFLVAASYLKRALFEPVGKLLDERRGRLQGDAKAKATAEQDREARLADYEARIIAAKKAAWDRREAIRQEAARARAAAIAAARQAGDQEIAKAREQLQADAAVARTTLEKDSPALGRLMVDRILGRRVEA